MKRPLHRKSCERRDVNKHREGERSIEGSPVSDPQRVRLPDDRQLG
jgi:hypothetical protein